MRHAGHHAEQGEDDRDRRPGAGRAELAADLAGEIHARGDAGDDGGGGDRQHQRRDLRDQRVTDREQHIIMRGIADRHAVADRTEDQAADDVGGEDQQAGDRVALHELGRTVHRAVEIGFGRHFDAARLGFFRRDQAGIEIGVDRHLLAGQGIQGEARRHFGHAAGALGHDDHVDDDQDGEDEQADDIVAADQEGAERLDDMTGGALALMAVHQHDAGRGDVEAEAEQGGEQQHGREGGEVERLLRVQRDHQHGQADRDVHDEEQVEQAPAGSARPSARPATGSRPAGRRNGPAARRRRA